MSTVYISLIETVKLELAGAEHRLDVARQTYRAFVEEHGVTVDGMFIYNPQPAREMRVSLEHERDSLECEVDEAARLVKHCEAILSDLQLAAAVETDSVSDLILGLPQAAEGNEENREPSRPE